MDTEDYFSVEEEDGDLYTTRRRGEQKRRFSEQQIKSLESMFESQAKLDPRKKLQLARELGLQPRQVAIWFQNKRARWKSKQMERQYEALRADYEVLLSGFEAMKKEKVNLVKQVQSLSEQLERPTGESSNNSDSNKGGNTGEENKENERPGFLMTEATNDEERKLSYACSEDETNLMNFWGEPASSSCYLADSTERQSGFDDGSCSPEKSCDATPTQWWEFWPITD